MLALLLIPHYCTENSSVAKSNAKERPGGRRMPRISLRSRPMLLKKLRMKKTFRLMYVGLSGSVHYGQSMADEQIRLVTFSSHPTPDTNDLCFIAIF